MKKLFLICITILISTAIQAQFIGYTVNYVMSAAKEIPSAEHVELFDEIEGEVGAGVILVEHSSGLVESHVFAKDPEDITKSKILGTRMAWPVSYANTVIETMHNKNFVYKETWYWYDYTYFVKEDSTHINIPLEYDLDVDDEMVILIITPMDL